MTAKLPTFVGIAAVKAGSTSIYRYLGEHPQVFVSPIKETNFFAYEGQKGKRFKVRSWNAYRHQFADVRDEKAIGEFSPQYVLHPGVPHRIAEALPEAKLVASLRSPADRAYSCWVGSARLGLDTRPADVAIQPGSRYIERGFYSRQLEGFLDLFSRERVKIIIFENFADDPIQEMSELYRFLNVDPTFTPNVHVRHNSARFPRFARLNRVWHGARRLQPRWFRAPDAIARWNRFLLERSYADPPPFDPALRSRLLEFYRDEVARMEELLRCELPMWRR